MVSFVGTRVLCAVFVLGHDAFGQSSFVLDPLQLKSKLPRSLKENPSLYLSFFFFFFFTINPTLSLFHGLGAEKFVRAGNIVCLFVFFLLRLIGNCFSLRTARSPPPNVQGHL